MSTLTQALSTRARRLSVAGRDCRSAAVDDARRIAAPLGQRAIRGQLSGAASPGTAAALDDRHALDSVDPDVDADVNLDAGGCGAVRALRGGGVSREHAADDAPDLAGRRHPAYGVARTGAAVDAAHLVRGRAAVLDSARMGMPALGHLATRRTLFRPDGAVDPGQARHPHWCRPADARGHVVARRRSRSGRMAPAGNPASPGDRHGTDTANSCEAVLAHELAHIKRHDYLVNLFQLVAETLFFYHPVVWWTSKQIRIERELCCDDIAVQSCGDPIGYARALTTLARHQLAAPAVAMAATGGSLLHRVQRLVGSTPREYASRARSRGRSLRRSSSLASYSISIGFRPSASRRSPRTSRASRSPQ